MLPYRYQIPPGLHGKISRPWFQSIRLNLKADDRFKSYVAHHMWKHVHTQTIIGLSILLIVLIYSFFLYFMFGNGPAS